jgi:hypothetical protein
LTIVFFRQGLTLAQAGLELSILQVLGLHAWLRDFSKREFTLSNRTGSNSNEKTILKFKYRFIFGVVGRK